MYVALITPDEIKSRFGAVRVKEALDDANSGSIPAAAMEGLIEDASSYVLEAYYVTFEHVPANEAIPPALRRLALAAAHAYLAQRAPEVFRIDWEKLFTWVRDQVTLLVKGARKVGVEPPDPAANHGGDVYPTPDPFNQINVPIFAGSGTWGIF